MAKISVVNAASGQYVAACTNGIAIRNPGRAPSAEPEAINSRIGVGRDDGGDATGDHDMAAAQSIGQGGVGGEREDLQEETGCPAVQSGAPGEGVHRVRALGEAVGRYLSGLDERVLLIGSGGLSHESPVPTLDTAPPHVVEGLIAGRHPSAEATAKRRANVLDAAKRFAAGKGNLKALNPNWGNTFLDQLAANDLDAIDE